MPSIGQSHYAILKRRNVFYLEKKILWGNLQYSKELRFFHLANFVTIGKNGSAMVPSLDYMMGAVRTSRPSSNNFRCVGQLASNYRMCSIIFPNKLFGYVAKCLSNPTSLGSKSENEIWSIKFLSVNSCGTHTTNFESKIALYQS